MVYGFDVHLPSLRKVPGMLEDLSADSGKCQRYAGEAFAPTTAGVGRTGVINLLAGTHSRVRQDVLDFFHAVDTFGNDQGAKVQEAVELYETTDRELAETLDQTLFDQPTQDDVREMGGRASELNLDAAVLQGMPPGDPVASLLPLTDYRADNPYEPDWKIPLKPEYAEDLSAARLVRDVIWHASSFAASLGFGRPYDVVEELVVPFTGDWAALKACGDALENLSRAASGLVGNTVWTADTINAVWHGIAADACWLHVRKLERSLRGAPDVLERYAAAYHDVVDEIMRLERIAGSTVMELADLAIRIPVSASVGGPVGVVVGMLLKAAIPPDGVIQMVQLIFELTDIVKLAIQAVWDFNARCELGMLVGPEGSLPAVPAASVGYT